MTSEQWAGFTDDDIQEIKSNTGVFEPSSDENCVNYREANVPKRIKILKLKSTVDCFKKEELHLGNESTDSGWQDAISEDELDQSLLTHIAHNTYLESEIADLQHESSMKSAKTIGPVEHSLCDQSHEEFCNGKSDLNVQSVETFEVRQKRIEAENARRRALISKAISDKRKRTQAETLKLAHVTQELNKIDSSFSADVAILRNYIEKASQEFSEAEKHYLKVEKEYVNAKIELYKKLQRKEMLTEHLSAIIEQNENRKAEKLVELMKQLELEILPADFSGVELLANKEEVNEEHESSVKL